MPDMDTARAVAKAILDIGAVGFTVDNPIAFKSGIKAPVYCDNRKFPFHPNAWRTVIDGFASLLKNKSIRADVIAGVEAAGIPHSAALGFHSGLPSVFVRKQAKDHGTKKLVEGGDVSGVNVVLVEDLVTTGGSSLAAVEALRNAGAIVTDVLVIVTYGFPESVAAFEKAGVRLHALTTFPTILTEAKARGAITKEEEEAVIVWSKDPHGWSN